MTLATWKKEFYPITAKQAARKGKVAAIEHSLKKWIGLRESNLKKHKMIYYRGVAVIFEENKNRFTFAISGTTCALCFKYGEKDCCTGCPLKSPYPFPCGHGAYGYWACTGNTKPMIKELRKALVEARRKVKP